MLLIKCKMLCCIFLVKMAWCQLPPKKNCPIPLPFWLALPHMITLKPSLPTNLFALPSPINITMTKQHKVSSYHLLLRQTSSAGLPPGQTNSASPSAHQWTTFKFAPHKFVHKISPMKRFPPWKNSPHTLWGKRQNETSQFLLNVLRACSNK